MSKKTTFKNVCRFLVLSVLFLSASGVWAASSEDYYQAGLTLYNSQNYGKAILYFGAAIKLNPQDPRAYQARGNCYYAQADYVDALQDYKQVQQLRPSPQIDNFVSVVQAKVGGQAPAPAVISGQAPDDYQQLFTTGKSAFQTNQYSLAAKNFEKALQLNHSDFSLYYYLGLTYKMMGDLKNAVVALGIANQKKPTPQIASYVKTLRLKLSQDDRDWADEQLSASAGGKDINLHTRPANATDFAFRLEPGVMFPNLTDFNAEANNGVTYAMAQNGTASYNASIPNFAANLGFEPVVNLEPDIELGFLIASIPVGTFSEQYTQGGNTLTNSFDITGYVLGLNFRWLIGTGPVKFFIGGGPLLTPISINYTQVVNSVPTTGSFVSWGLGGQAQVGVDFHLSDNISFGPFVSLQVISANNFTGVVTDNSDNIVTTGTLYTLPNGQWPSIVPVTASESAPSGAKTTTVDLSGVVPGIHLSMFF